MAVYRLCLVAALLIRVGAQVTVAPVAAAEVDSEPAEEVHTGNEPDPLDSIPDGKPEAPEPDVDLAVQKEIDEDAAKMDHTDEETSEDAEPMSMVTEDVAEEMSLPEDDYEEPEDEKEEHFDMTSHDEHFENAVFLQSDDLSDEVDDESDEEDDHVSDEVLSDDAEETETEGEDEGQAGHNVDADEEDENVVDSDKYLLSADKPNDALTAEDMYDDENNDHDESEEGSDITNLADIVGADQLGEEDSGVELDYQEETDATKELAMMQTDDEDDAADDEDDSADDKDGAVNEVVSDKKAEEEDDDGKEDEEEEE